MHFSALVLTTLALSARVIAQSAVSCGSNVYTDEQIQEAADEACRLFESGRQLGRNNYPHRYNNFEGFTFDNIRGPFQEFPLLRRGVYTGNSPGPDRVIITENCELAGQITHTGASRNGFVDCDNAISVRTQGNNSSGNDTNSGDSTSSDSTSSDSTSSGNNNNNNGGSSNSSDDDDSGSSRLGSGVGPMLAAAGTVVLALFA
ncbi:guanyl-specific ribonuclease F1 [Verticillium alfalfae VaMs.102]|uniref:ribonuclease T1 n=1 Tax=Verticillium alfalfae (strain VaMs.102 / ATCC MYA-4576 / FGSC 10136) TaxID=526221 RepID=C9S652_VERA1|nr:guanyl-specific ribonuclease F1 [Verticillium alfalfae VaMs.102]EEY14391.1 guanyl-specific ribonuclease F1 [Verticillium alfalfae VaMs.102]